MKDNAIKTLTEKTGDKGAAEAIWKVFVDKVFGGMQPTEVMMKTVDKDDALNAVPVGYRGPLAALWPESAAPKDPPRGRKFKPEKARAYSAAEVVAFIAADPKVEGLRAEYMRRTGGEPALFYVDSKLAEAESADRIQRLFDRDPVAPFVTIGGRDVKPSGYPNDAPKEDAEDPYERGVALGQPGDVSVRLGVSLAGISHETRQAIRCAVTFDLADASTRELQADAAAAMGQSAIVYLANKPKAYREWPTWKKPSLVLARPFVEAVTVAPRAPAFDLGATAPTSGAPQFMMVGARLAPAAANLLSTHLVAAKRQGTLVLTDDASFPTGCSEPHEVMRRFETSAAILVLVTANTIADDTIMALAARAQREKKPVVPVIVSACDWQESTLRGLVYLPRDDRFMTDERTGAVVASEVRTLAGKLKAPVATVSVAPSAREVCDAIIRLGIDRASLLAGIDRAFVATLRDAPTRASQMWQDIIAIWDLTLTDKSRPIRTYLKNALLFAANRPEARILEDALASC
jgi:hypothetical protein